MDKSEEKNSKHSSIFSKIFQTIIVLIIGWFIVQWLVTDLRDTPINQFTLKDISSLFFSSIVGVIVINVIKSIVNED